MAGKLEAGAEKAAAEQGTAPAPKPSRTAPPRARRTRDKGVVEEVVTSTTFRQVLRTAAREIVRGAFKTGRR